MKLTTFTEKMTKVLKQKYLEEWYSLRDFFHWETGHIHEMKCNFDIEKYLITVNFAFRSDTARLRISSHRLNIEAVSYTKSFMH